jgi:hypothetical protein
MQQATWRIAVEIEIVSSHILYRGPLCGWFRVSNAEVHEFIRFRFDREENHVDMDTWLFVLPPSRSSSSGRDREANTREYDCTMRSFDLAVLIFY